MSNHLQRYEEKLGVPPGADLDEIQNAYYFALENLGERLTEEQEARLLELKHAYEILRKASEARPARKPVAASATPVGTAEPFRLRRRTGRRGLWIAGALAVSVLGAVMFVQSAHFKLSTTHFDPGATLTLHDPGTPYATVLQYEPEHRFHVGKPTPAYRMRLAETGEEIWLAERVVEQAMRPLARP